MLSSSIVKLTGPARDPYVSQREHAGARKTCKGSYPYILARTYATQASREYHTALLRAR